MIVIVKNPGSCDSLLRSNGMIVLHSIDQAAVQVILNANKLMIQDHFDYQPTYEGFGGFAMLADLFDAVQIPRGGIRFFTFASSTVPDPRLRVLQDAQISGSYKMPEDDRYFFDHILRCTTQPSTYFLRRYKAAQVPQPSGWAKVASFFKAIKAALI